LKGAAEDQDVRRGVNPIVSAAFNANKGATRSFRISRRARRRTNVDRSSPL